MFLGLLKLFMIFAGYFFLMYGNVLFCFLAELTITDVQSEILLTQIRYIIKTLKGCANDKQPGSEVDKNASEKVEETLPPSTDSSQFTPAIIEKYNSYQEESMQINMNVLGASNEFQNDLKLKVNIYFFLNDFNISLYALFLFIFW